MDDVTASIIIACQTAGAVTSINKLGFALGMLGQRAFSFGAESVKVFSDLQEETQKFGIVFAGVNGQANAVVQDLIDNFGQSELSARKMMAQTGDMLTGFGLGSRDVLDLSAAMSKMGADIASFTNYVGGAEGATYALTKAMLGETEQAKMLGVAIKTDTPEFRKFEKQAQSTGIYIKELGRTFTASTTQEARAIAVAATIYEQKAHVLGDFARNQDSIANQSRTLSNRFVELKAQIGGMIEDIFNISGNTGSLADTFEKVGSTIKREGKIWAYVISSFLLDVREGGEIVLAFLEPVWTSVTAGFKNLMNLGGWLYENWVPIWDNMSDIAIAAGKDILNGILFVPKLIIKAFSEGFSAIGSMAVDQFKNIKDLFTGKIGFGDFYRKSFENVSSKFSEHIDHILTEGVKQFGELGKNTERALAQAGASPFPELATPDFSAWADPDEVLKRVKRESDARREKLKERFSASLKNTPKKGEDENSNPSNDFVVSMKKIADDIFRYRETTQSAILANSLEGIRLQSRQFINNSPQMQLVNQGKRTIALLEKVERSLTKMNQNGTALTFRNA